MLRFAVVTCGWVFVCFATSGLAGEPTDIRELKLRDWQPRSMLVTKSTIVERPMFPAIDVHNHLGGGKQVLTPERVAGLSRRR